MEDNTSASPCRYIALDIHKYYSVVAGVDREGKEILSACRVEHVDLENWSIKHLPANGSSGDRIDDECLARVRSAGATGGRSAGG